METDHYAECLFLYLKNDADIYKQIQSITASTPPHKRVAKAINNLPHRHLIRKRAGIPLDPVKFRVNWTATFSALFADWDPDAPQYLDDKYAPFLAAQDLHENAENKDLTMKEDTVTTSPTIAAPMFETKHFIRGHDAHNLTDDDLIKTIQGLENQLKALETITTKSKGIEAKAAQLKADLNNVVELLDSRHA